MTLVALSDNGCRDTITEGIVIYPALDLEISNDGNSFLLAGDQATLSVPSGYDTIIWNNDSSVLTASYTATEPGTYSVLVKDSIGCVFNDSIIIGSFNSDVELYNLVTPNGDGSNDTWNLEMLTNSFNACAVTIYNKWGTIVYQSGSYDNTWDGSSNSSLLPDGSYYYTIDCDGGDFTRNGSLTILK